MVLGIEKTHLDKQGHEEHKKNLDRNGFQHAGPMLDLHIFLPSLGCAVVICCSPRAYGSPC